MIYLAKADGQVIGKLSEQEIRAKISAGNVSPDDQYLVEGTKEWKRVTEFPGANFPWPARAVPDHIQRKYATSISKPTLLDWLASRTKTFWIITGIIAFVLLLNPMPTGGLLGLLRGLIVLVLLLGLYFLPTIAARGKRNFQAIFVLNFLLGWTILGWAVAMVWAYTKDPGED